MFLDDMFKIKISAKMMKNFMGFGYTVESGIIEGIFYGSIHRFAIFCEEKSGDVTYETIKHHLFKDNISSFRKIYSELDKDNDYTKYESTFDGEPVLNVEKIRETRYSL